MTKIKKRDGFEGEKYIHIPRTALFNAFRENPFMKQLYITYIGYFPKAAYHYRKRPSGCDDNIFIYCTRGKGWFILDGKKAEVEQNEYIIVPSTTAAMSYGADETTPWTIYWVHFTGTDMEAFNQGFNIGLHDGAKQLLLNETGIELWEAMFEILEQGYSKENLMKTNLLLYHFLSTFLYPDKHVNEKVQDEKDMVKETTLFMKNNLKNKLTVESMASKNNLSTSHFSSLFRKGTGMSPMDFLIHLKLQKACVMLSGSDVRIKEIANEVGYDDPFHFSRIFKKNMKVSPHNYRMLRRNKEQ